MQRAFARQHLTRRERFAAEHGMIGECALAEAVDREDRRKVDIAGGPAQARDQRRRRFVDETRLDREAGQAFGRVDARDALRALGERRGTSMAGVALAWLLADERIGQVVIGPGRPAHLEPLREALERPLTPTERDEVGAIFQR